jgi:hypothetical protein
VRAPSARRREPSERRGRRLHRSFEAVAHHRFGGEWLKIGRTGRVTCGRQVRSLAFPDLFPGFVPVARGVERSLLRARRKAATLRRSSIASARWEAHRDRVALVKRFVFGLDTRARSSADTSPVSGNMIAMRCVAAHELRFRMPSRSSDRQGWISRVQFLVRSPLRSRFTGASHIGLAR